MARPWGSVRVMHQAVAGLAARVSARARQVSGAVGPRPGMSPGLSVRPSQAVAGMVRWTVPPSRGPAVPGSLSPGAVVLPGARPAGAGGPGAGPAGARRAGGAGSAGQCGTGRVVVAAGGGGDEAGQGLVGEQGREGLGAQFVEGAFRAVGFEPAGV